MGSRSTLFGYLYSDSLEAKEFGHLEFEYVIAHGVFSSDRRHHPGLYRGSIIDVESVVPLPSPENDQVNLLSEGENEVQIQSSP